MTYQNSSNNMRPRTSRKSDDLLLASLFPSIDKQQARLLERKKSGTLLVDVLGTRFQVFRGVYRTGVDTELMVSSILNSSRLEDKTFLEVGCGCGAVSLLLAERCKHGVGSDINPVAVRNAQRNRQHLGCTNVDFHISDVFENITGKYDVIVCNPPYNQHQVIDVADRMFWDPGNEMKRKFFASVRQFLKRRGRVYFGWANFADIDGTLPLRLARSAGLQYVRHFGAPSRNRAQRFFVVELAEEGSALRRAPFQEKN